MYTNIECIALRTVAYSDSKAIVTAWSRQMGRVSLAVPAGSGREARRLRALMMPLGLFDGCIDIKPGRDIFNIRDVRPLSVHTDIAFDPAKGLVAMFLGEVLDRVLRVSAHDPMLTDFIFGATDLLEAVNTRRGTANYVVVFMCKLMRMLGIEPDWGSYTPDSVFDMVDGLFRSAPPSDHRWLDPREAATAHLLGRMGWPTIERLRLPREVRRAMLTRMIEYYTLHGFNLSTLKSLDIAQEIF